MKSTDKLMDMLCAELDEIAEKGQLSAGDLDTVHKLIVSKEKLLRCEELEGDLGYSEDGGWNASGTYANGMRSYGNGNSYGNRHGNGSSYARRYSRGRRGYSMDDGKGWIVSELQDMMQRNDLSIADRAEIEKAINILQK